MTCVQDSELQRIHRELREARGRLDSQPADRLLLLGANAQNLGEFGRSARLRYRRIWDGNQEVQGDVGVLVVTNQVPAKVRVELAQNCHGRGICFVDVGQHDGMLTRSLKQQMRNWQAPVVLEAPASDEPTILAEEHSSVPTDGVLPNPVNPVPLRSNGRVMSGELASVIKLWLSQHPAVSRKPDAPFKREVTAIHAYAQSLGFPSSRRAILGCYRHHVGSGAKKRGAGKAMAVSMDAPIVAVPTASEVPDLRAAESIVVPAPTQDSVADSSYPPVTPVAAISAGRASESKVVQEGESSNSDNALPDLARALADCKAAGDLAREAQQRITEVVVPQLVAALDARIADARRLVREGASIQVEALRQQLRDRDGQIGRLEADLAECESIRRSTAENESQLDRLRQETAEQQARLKLYEQLEAAHPAVRHLREATEKTNAALAALGNQK